MSRFKYFLTCFILVTVFSTSVFGERKCKVCNSKDAPACAQDPESIEGPCSAAEEGCFTYINSEGVTFRGCEKQTDCNDPKCTSCNGSDFCNSAIFPSDRLKCHQCTGSDCGKSIDASVTGTPCRIYKEKDECYTNVEDNKSTVRGCLSDVAPPKCTDGMCKKCFDSGCNREAAESTQKCYECDSQKNDNCKRPEPYPESGCVIETSTSTCDDVVLLGRETECFTYHKDNIVKRGCKATKPSNATNNDIVTCPTPECNKLCFPDAICYVCDLDKEAKCTADKLDEALKKTCDKFVTSCYQCETLDGKRATRGCGLNAEENLVCKNCHGTECNKKNLPRSCYVCNSSDDPACTKNDMPAQFCADENDECLVMLTEAGETIRGCKSKITAECKAPNCKTCKEHNCNSDVLVKDTLICYFCDDSVACKDAQTDASKTEVCSKAGDHCYMYSADGTKMSRGCVASPNAPKNCSGENIDSKCVKCDTNRCNKMADLTTSELSCIQCSANNETCAFRFDPKSATKCEGKVEYHSFESCFSITTGEKVTRGCTFGSTECSIYNPQCRYCYENGCNTYSTKRSTCVRCRSDNAGQRSCKDKEQTVDKSQCTNAATFESQGCYTENYGGVIIRGCLSDLNTLDFNNCQNTKYKKCDPCQGDNCNNKAAPDSSTMIYASFSIVAFCSVFVIKFMI